MFRSIASGILRFILHVLYFMRVKGRRNMPKEGGVFLCSNHSSFWDPVVLGVTCGRKTEFMAKKELFKSPLFGALIKALGAYPIKRGGGDIFAIRTAMEIVRGGGVTVIFPEGRRVKNPGERTRINNAIIKLAIQTKCPIQPVGINEKYKIFGGLRAVYGEPIYYSDYYNNKPSDEELDALAEDLMNKIYELGGLA